MTEPTLRSRLEPLVEGETLDRLVRYGELLLDANTKFNLTGAKNVAELAPHLLDSLTLCDRVEGPLVDIGSGGGLPAIPVAIATGVPVTMVETTLKKARFLEEMLAAFGLEGEVVAERAEIAAHDPRLRGMFRCGTARAVSSAPTVAELLLPFLAEGGFALLQRGTIEPRELNALRDASLILGGEVESETPMGEGRRIVVVRKTGPTPAKYPRRVGVPEKKPLCY